MEKEEKRKQGRRNRIKGRQFENKVRQELTDNGWLVFKNDHNVEFINDKGYFLPAKKKFNPFTKRIMMIGSGFPDFVCIHPSMKHTIVQFIECKMNKYLDKIERKRIKWLKAHFHIPCYIAFQEKEGRKNIIKYMEV